MTKLISRRSFLAGCGTAAAALAATSLQSRLGHVALAQPGGIPAYVPEALVVVFLRGGWDALNVIMPLGGTDRGIYEQSRPNLKVPLSGTNAALYLDGQFGMHRAMAPLLPLYQANKLAIVHACGLTFDTRSHFDAQMFIELGTPGVKTTPDGWLTRLLQTWPGLPKDLMLPALSAGGSQALSLAGTNNAVAMSTPSSFSLNGHWKYELDQRAALRDLYNEANWLGLAGTETLNMVDLIEAANPGNYTPANGAAYPSGSFGDNLKTIAQLIKMKLGLRVATIDVGGWDTHRSQGDGGAGNLSDNLLKPLSQGLAAFYTDLTAGCGADYHNHTTVVVVSEFGRRLKENANRGTDHGHGSVQLVLGGSVKGGKVYGAWPGLGSSQLYDGADLAVTTDFRQVLAEIIGGRLGNYKFDTVFPGFSGYAPLGLVDVLYPAPGVPPGSPTSSVFVPYIESQAVSCP